MKTSNFETYKEDDGVGIAVEAPPDFTGPSYPDLFPEWSFLNKYKADGDKAAYIQAYYQRVLSKLDPQKVYDDLSESVLLCYEEPGEFCHRRLVAEWLEKELGVSIPEVDHT